MAAVGTAIGHATPGAPAASLAPDGVSGAPVAVVVSDPWDPRRYSRFAAERRQPFDDLLRLVDPVPGGRAVDLGCGGGELTVELHRHLGAAETVGVDSSPAMLAEAAGRAGGGVSFLLGDLAAWDGGPVDVVAASASLQWVGDHPALLARLAGSLSPGGQLAFQVPANVDHPSHLLAAAMAGEPAWSSRLAGGDAGVRSAQVLAPEVYAEILDGLGLTGLHVRMQVYGHHLADASSVVDWVEGTLLNPHRAALGDDYPAFADEYRARLVARLGPGRPYFYAFKRILARAARPR